MPHDSNGVFYPAVSTLSGASIAPRLITATISLPTTPFSLEAAQNLFGTLSIHEFLTTALAGANNDLTFIAKTPGSSDITIQYRDPAANNAALSVTVQEYLQTALAGSNNDLVWRAVAEGATTITIAYIDPAGNDAVEAVVVTGDATVGWTITVNLATGVAGAITSTGDTIKASILASAAATALVTAVDAASNDGSGAVTALAATALGGGDIIVNLATGVAGAITTTATQLKAAIEADPLASLLVAVSYSGADTGAGAVIALAKTVFTGPLGTNPTLDVALHHGGPSGTPLASHSAFAQKTTATTEFKSFAAVAATAQWVFTLGGTSTPIFAVSLDAFYRR